ncbi:MAG TPA: SRPBCC family protein [Hyphomicrobium sp.]|nr:SRPBCC family protein [Hyphomicrobium sp.]
MKLYRFDVLALLVITGVFSAADSASAATLSSRETIAIKADPKAVNEDAKVLWERFGNFCEIAEWHPAVRSCTEGKESGVVYRTLSLEDGGKIKEKLLGLGASGYRYAIVESPLPVKNYEAEFVVTPDKDGVTIVWSASYAASDGKSDNDARSAVDSVLRAGIASIKSKLPDSLKDHVAGKADAGTKN